MSLRGAGQIRLRLDQNWVLTREPDTVSTVVGKDAEMGYARGIALHLDGFAMRYFFYGGLRKMANKTKRLTESAMLLAVAVVLELVSKMFIPPMPLGGHLTIVHMLPVVLISYRHGMKWGFTAAFTYSLIQMMLGMDSVSAAFLPGSDEFLGAKAILMVLLDYIGAYTLLGLGGLFRDRIRTGGMALMCGSLVALSARYASHVTSGYILYASWAEWFFTQDGFPAWGGWLVENLTPEMLGFVYSVVYNGMVMIPEMVLTAAMSLVIARIPGVVQKIG